LYFVAVASNSADKVDVHSSILIDNSNAMLREKDRQIQETVLDLQATKESAAEAETWLQQKLQERDDQIQHLKTVQEWYEGEVRNREKTIAERDATIASNEEALTWRAGQVDVLQKEKADLIKLVETTTQRLSRTTEQLEAIHAS